jgi:hypothetical protein
MHSKKSSQHILEKKNDSSTIELLTFSGFHNTKQ